MTTLLDAAEIAERLATQAEMVDNMSDLDAEALLILAEHARATCPTPMLLWCPACGERHCDVGPFATKLHHTHACQSCGMVWRPAIAPTVGVQFLPGFKNEAGQ